MRYGGFGQPARTLHRGRAPRMGGSKAGLSTSCYGTRKEGGEMKKVLFVLCFMLAGAIPVAAVFTPAVRV